MRIRFSSNSMLCHVWANQSQGYGRGNSLSFSDGTLTSFATPVARIVKGANGQNVPLFSSQRYSSRTSVHLSHARRAINYGGFEVPSLGVTGGWCREPYRADGSPDHNRNIAHLIARYTGRIATFRQMLSDPYDIAGNLERLAQDVRSYCAAFALDVPSLDPDADARVILEYREERAARRNTPAAIAKRERDKARRRAEDAARDAREREAHAESIAQWRQGENTYLSWGAQRTDTGSAMLRLRGDDTVQTSQGAEVPLHHARRLFAIVAACRANSCEFTPNGHAIRVGHFTVSRIDASGNLTAGCHYIDWREISRFAKSMSWTVELPGIDCALHAEEV